MLLKLFLSFLVVFLGVFGLCWHFKVIIKSALQNSKVVLIGLLSLLCSVIISVFVVYFL
jgi:hypothetical protein